ncbi:MAG: cbb3-type cytochrome oxidase assembly protein CcoS [Chlorobi bacterium]|nr:cbb3-type cytochrome oxidase assembly protein CcoS [Chlorobiota bacterium]
MTVLYVLIGFSLFVALIFLALFIWSVKSGQYEDRYTPSVRMLFDQDDTSEIKSDREIQKTGEENNGT